MAYTTIDDPTIYFNSVLWTGNGSNRDITGVGFEPNFVWIKQRNGTFSHVLGNSVSGDNKFLTSNSSSAEDTDSDKFRTFVSDGFQVGTHNGVNGSSNTYVGWSWKETATAGFDIVAYTGTGSNATVGHGIDTPKMIIVKNRSVTQEWAVYHASLGATKYLELNLTGASGTASNRWNNTAPTSSVFSVGSDASVNGSSNNMIAYCFAEKKGYSKFGSYTGNGSASSGPYVHLGFKPAWVMIKRSGGTGSWEIYDSKRDGFNPQVHGLTANTTNAEDNTDDLLDLLSNGFKLYHDGSGLNTSGSAYIYAAFAEAPFVNSKGKPNNAR